ncbi:MAG: hypothetical protein ACK4VV_07845 [Pseudomonas sp.]
MKVLKVSNVLYTSAFALALGLAAPHVVAENHADHGAGAATTQEQMDKQERKDRKDHKRQEGMQERDTQAPTGTTGPGSDNPGAPPHTPGGTNPDGAPDHDRTE